MAKQKKIKKKKCKSIPHRKLLKRKHSQIKMSEIMWEFASDYILPGKDLERKQNLLNSAASAWNIANLPSERREEALDKYLEHFKAMNPDIDIVDDLREDMEKLIEEKVKNFSHITRQILNAKIYEEDDKFRINVVSTLLPSEFRKK